MDKKILTNFILKARTKTYAGNTGQAKPLLEGAKQYEYKENEWLYRDIYYQGNGKFIGLETVYFQKKSVLSVSYYGNFSKMTEEEADKILRKTLIINANRTRLWHKVVYKIEKYVYTNNGSGNIDEFEGRENILKNGKTVFFSYYAGAFIG